MEACVQYYVLDSRYVCSIISAGGVFSCGNVESRVGSIGFLLRGVCGSLKSSAILWTHGSGNEFLAGAVWLQRLPNLLLRYFLLIDLFWLWFSASSQCPLGPSPDPPATRAVHSCYERSGTVLLRATELLHPTG